MRIFTIVVFSLSFYSLSAANPDWDFTGYSSDTTVYINGGVLPLVVQGGSDGAIIDGYYRGLTVTSTGTAIKGDAGYYNGTGVEAIGNYGLNASGAYYGVYASSDNIGVAGLGYTGVYAEGSNLGLSVFSYTGTGGDITSSYGRGLDVHGYDNAIRGTVTHTAQNTPGVSGISAQGHGLNGNGLIGVSGYSSGTVNNTYGVYGNANGSGNSYSTYGVFGTAANGSTNWSGYFTGNVYVGGTFSNPSDIKFKKNIKPLQGSLDKVMALKPKTYDMKVEEFKGKVMLPEGNRYGLIAQELETVLPDLVHKVSAPAELPNPSDPTSKSASQGANTDFKSVDYISLIPILIGAIQEQQAEIESLKKAAGR